MARPAPAASAGSVTSKLGPIVVSTPNPLRTRRSSQTPEPGLVSACQKKLMGLVTAPVGLVGLTLSGSVMPAADTVIVWPTCGVVLLSVRKPTGWLLSPGTRTIA